MGKLVEAAEGRQGCAAGLSAEGRPDKLEDDAESRLELALVGGIVAVDIALLLVGELRPVAGADLLSEDAQLKREPVVQLGTDRWG